MIHHVTREIPPAALDRCLSFYGLLGFQEVQPPPGIAGRAVWLERQGTQVHLMPTPDASPQTGHVGVVVDGYEAAVERLTREGYEVEPRRRHWGAARAYVRDPAGNLVELMASPPGPGRGVPTAPGPAAGGE